MKIGQDLAQLPTAVNQVKNRDTSLRQATQQELDRIKSNPREDSISFHLSKSLNAWENPYTEQDALLAKWQKENYWDGQGNLIRIGLPDEDTLKAFQEELQARGEEPAGGIDWGNLQVDLRGVNSYAGGELSTQIDYLASRYAVLSEKIQADSTGQEKLDQLAKLNGMFQETAKKLAENFSKEVGGFLEENGAEGEKQKIYDSVVSGIQQRTEEYAGYLKKNEDYAGLEESLDQWLHGDDEYLAARLRDAETQSAAGQARDSLYSIQDLEVSSKFVDQLKEQSDGLQTGFFTVENEESIGLDLAVLSMKTDVMLREKGVGGQMGAAIRKALDGYRENYLDKIQSQLSQYRHNASLAADGTGFAALSKEDVSAVYQRTMEVYQKTGDFMKALLAGEKAGSAQYQNKVNSGKVQGVYRYSSGNHFQWANFYSVNSAGGSRKGYDYTTSTLQKYKDNWAQFTKSLSGKNSKIDLCLYSGGLSIKKSIATRPDSLETWWASRA